MTRYVTPAMRQRDEIAWQALVAGATAAPSETETRPAPRSWERPRIDCPECNGWGQHVHRGTGPLGTNTATVCEECEGCGWVETDHPDED